VLCAADVWASSNGGVQWVQLTAAAAWTARANVNMVITSDGVMVIAAGSDFNSLTKADAWLSVDGSIWLQLKPVSAQMIFSPRDWAAMALDSGNYLWLMGGTLRLQGDPNNPPACSDAYRSSAAITTANVATWFAAAGMMLPVVVGAGGVALASGSDLDNVFFEGRLVWLAIEVCRLRESAESVAVKTQPLWESYCSTTPPRPPLCRITTKGCLIRALERGGKDCWESQQGDGV
jgi:hypothetical protein